MGYHFVIDEVETETSVKRGETIAVRLVVENVGVAPIYKRLPLYIRLKSNAIEKTFETDIDIRKWIEGKYEENVVLEIPKEMPVGEYELQIGIGGNGVPSAVFACDAKQDESYSILTTLTVI